MRAVGRWESEVNMRSRTIMSACALALGSAAVLATAAAQGKPPFVIEDNALKMPGPVVFETGSEVLKPESDEVLIHAKDYLDDKSYVSLMRIEGHIDSTGADSTGASEEGQALSERRALAVARWLVKKGVDCKRLIPIGFGDTKPIAPNDTTENRALNRRMVFANAALRGRAIGGMPADGGGRVAGDPCK